MSFRPRRHQRNRSPNPRPIHVVPPEPNEALGITSICFPGGAALSIMFDRPVLGAGFSYEPTLWQVGSEHPVSISIDRSIQATLQLTADVAAGDAINLPQDGLLTTFSGIIFPGFVGLVPPAGSILDYTITGAKQITVEFATPMDTTATAVPLVWFAKADETTGAIPSTTYATAINYTNATHAVLTFPDNVPNDTGGKTFVVFEPSDAWYPVGGDSMPYNCIYH